MFHDFYFGSVLSSCFFSPLRSIRRCLEKFEKDFFRATFFYLSRARRGLFLVPEFKSPSSDASWKLFQVRRKKIEPMHYLQMNKKNERLKNCKMLCY